MREELQVSAPFAGALFALSDAYLARSVADIAPILFFFPFSFVADLGCLSRIRFFHPGSRVKKFPEPGSRGSKSASKNLSYF
jgi:hypothetical protein